MNIDEWIQQRGVHTWAEREGLLMVDLGGVHGSQPYAPWLIVDQASGAHVQADVFDWLASTPDDAVGLIRAVDFLEHIPDKIGLMNELFRVLAPEGILATLTPSTDGKGAFCDPTHVSFWNDLSFRYYCDDNYRKYVPEVSAQFNQIVVQTVIRDELPYVVAILTKP